MATWAPAGSIASSPLTDAMKFALAWGCPRWSLSNEEGGLDHLCVGWAWEGTVDWIAWVVGASQRSVSLWEGGWSPRTACGRACLACCSR